MSPIVSTIEIACPPEAVFSYVTDTSRFGEWQADIVRVRAEGERITTTRRIGRGERTFTQEIVSNDPPRRWAARGIDGPIRPSMEITVEPAGGGRSQVTFALDFHPRGIGRLLVPLVIRERARKGAPMSYQRLKERLENRMHGNMRTS